MKNRNWHSCPKCNGTGRWCYVCAGEFKNFYCGNVHQNCEQYCPTCRFHFEQLDAAVILAARRIQCAVNNTTVGGMNWPMVINTACEDAIRNSKENHPPIHSRLAELEERLQRALLRVREAEGEAEKWRLAHLNSNKRFQWVANEYERKFKEKRDGDAYKELETNKKTLEETLAFIDQLLMCARENFQEALFAKANPIKKKMLDMIYGPD